MSKSSMIIDSAIKYYYRKKYRIRDLHRYQAPCDPIKLIWISPDSINRFTHRMRPRNENKEGHIGTVRNGDWDKLGSSPTKPNYPDWKNRFFDEDDIESSVFYQSLERRFIEGVSWEETMWFAEMRDLVNSGRSFWHGCTNVDDIKSRCKEVDELYHAISEQGYRAQREIYRRKILPKRLMHEVNVDIGEDGEYLLSDGIHRIAISKILDIDKIAVTVLVRHESWMEYRDAKWAIGEESAHKDMAEFYETVPTC